MTELILASSSPYRKALLAGSGLDFICVKPEVDESAIAAGTPEQRARKRAEAKAANVAWQYKSSYVIGCDQVLEFEGKAFDKVASYEQARMRIKTLAGHVHFLLSAYCIARFQEETSRVCIVDSKIIRVAMQMRELTDSEIEAYLQTNEWQGSVGCYQFENLGMNLFDSVVGDTSSVIGLPLIPLLRSLREVGVKVL